MEQQNNKAGINHNVVAKYQGLVEVAFGKATEVSDRTSLEVAAVLQSEVIFQLNEQLLADPKAWEVFDGVSICGVECGLDTDGINITIAVQLELREPRLFPNNDNDGYLPLGYHQHFELYYDPQEQSYPLFAGIPDFSQELFQEIMDVAQQRHAALQSL